MSMLIGAAPQSLSGSDFQALDDKAGPWTLRRSYESAAIGWSFTNWATSRGGIDVGKRASLWSCKPDLVALGNGAYDAKITAFVDSIPSDHLAILSIWHEVDGKIRSGAKDARGDVITKDRWLAAIRRFCGAVDAAQHPRVYTAVLLEAWSGMQPKPGTTYADLWPGDGYADVFGIDGYSDIGSEGQVWDPGVEFAAAHGVPWGIHELGCKGTLSPDWMARNAVYAADHGASFISWFSNSNDAVPTPGTDPAAAACSRALSLAYQADLSAATLS